MCRKLMEPVQNTNCEPPEVCIVRMLDTWLTIAAQTSVAVYTNHGSAFKAELLDVLSLC